MSDKQPSEMYDSASTSSKISPVVQFFMNSLLPKKWYSIASFKSGNYEVEVARKHPTPPRISHGTEATIPSVKGSIDIAIAHDDLQIERVNGPLTKVHLNGKTLTEKGLDDVLRKKNYELIIQEPDAITENLKQSLLTISQISERLKYNPVEYIRNVLGIDPLDYVADSDLEMKNSERGRYNPDALTLAFLKILGYYRIKEDCDIMGEPHPTKRVDRVVADAQRMKDLKSRMPQNSDYNLQELFEEMFWLKRNTVHATNVEEVVNIIQKPKEEREGILLKDLDHPLELVACVIYDKFGMEATNNFLKKYFPEEKSLAQPKVQSNRQRLTKDVSAFVAEYAEAEENFTDTLTRRIISDNLSNMNLFSSCLHPFEDIVLINEEGVLPELSRIDVIVEKKDGGIEKRHYFLDGEKIDFSQPVVFKTKKQGFEIDEGETKRTERINSIIESIRQSNPVISDKRRLLSNDLMRAVDAVNSLRKKGDFKEGSGFIYEKQLVENDKRINFNNIFLLQKYGIWPRDSSTGEKKHLTEAELQIASTLEEIDKSEFEFKYEALPETRYELFYNGKSITKTFIPQKVDVEKIKTMTLEEAMTGGPEAEFCLQAYQIVQRMNNISDEDLLLGKVSLEGVEFKPSSKKTYKVLRRLRNSADRFREISKINIDSSNKIELLDQLSVRDLQGGEVTTAQKEDSLELMKIKFADFDYIENGSVSILRKQSLDEFLEDFNNNLFGAAKYLDVKAIRITNTANKKYFETLLEKFLDDSKIDEEEIAELIKQRDKTGATITNDDHRRLVLQAQFMSKRSLIDTVMEPIASMASDKLLTIPEKFLYEIYMSVLKSENVPQELMSFIKARTDAMIDEREESRIALERQIVRDIRSTIFTGNGPLEKNRNYNALLNKLTEIIIPKIKDADTMEEVKNRYNAQFLKNVFKFVDELPSEGKSIFADSFYEKFNTGKEDLLSRINKLIDDAEVIENFGFIRFVVDTFKNGYEITTEHLRKYAIGMANLPDDLVARAIGNMRTWCSTNLERETLEQLTEKLSFKEISDTLKERTLSGQGMPQNGIDKGTDIVFEILLKRLNQLKGKYNIKKTAVDDKDLDNVFGEGDSF